MILDKEILPYGYSIFRNDRPSRGGGVLVAIKNSLSSRIVPSPSHLELIAVSLWKSSTLFLLYIYPRILPLSYSMKRYLTSNNIVPQIKHVIVIGDFNLPDIN